MANDQIPQRTQRQNEYENFADNLNGKVIRRVEDEAAVEILNLILAALGGTVATPFFSEVQTVTTPGVTQILTSDTVGVGKSLVLKSVRVTARKETTYEIFIDGTIVGSGRVGPGKLTDDFIFNVDRTATAGQVVKVEATALPGSATDIESYLQALEI